MVMRTAAMSGDLSCEQAAKCDINRVQALLSNGFQVGSDQAVNKLGRTYHYVAIRSDACVSDFRVGSYVGNGVDQRAINGIGLQPAYLLVKRGDTATVAVQRFAGEVGDASMPVNSSSGEVTNRIESLTSNGFVVGTHAAVNATGDTYYWAAWAAAAGGATTATYVGNGSNGRSVTGAGLAPTWVLVRGTGSRQTVHRPSSISPSADLTLFLAGSNAARACSATASPSARTIR
jgi:hypothetical protein